MPTDPIMELASQLQAFIGTKHLFASELDPATLQLIESCAPPPGLPPASTERGSRSAAPPPEASPYPIQWAETRTHIRTAVRQLERLLKQQAAPGPISATPGASQSHANHPIDSIITEESALPISTTQVPETRQIISQDTTTMAGSSDLSMEPGAPRPGTDERQDLRQEIMQMVIDLLEQRLDQRDRQRQLSGTAAPPDPNGSTQSTTSSDTTVPATLKASEIGFFYPNMPPTWGDKDIFEKDGKLYY